MQASGLTCSEGSQDIERDATTVNLRALCILAMYLGGYQAAGEHSSELGGYFSDHQPISWYLNSLSVDMEDIWNLARRQGILDTDGLNYWEDDDTDIDCLCELAVDLVIDQTNTIYSALVKHYGDKGELFVSWWNSRRDSDRNECWGEIFSRADIDDGTLEAWEYVQDGMKDFILN